MTGQQHGASLTVSNAPGVRRGLAPGLPARRCDVRLTVQFLAMPKPKRDRTVRREAARNLTKLHSARERLFRLDAGGSVERPVEVETPAVVEVRARGVPCPKCGGEHDVLEHAAVTTELGSLREVRLRCRRCGSHRSLWFRLRKLD